MAHEVERIAYTGETPWHGLGTRVPGHMTWAEGLEAGGLAWDVRLQNLYTPTHFRDGETLGVMSFNVIKSHQAVVRSTDDSILGVVSRKYKPIQNREAFTVFERLFGSEGRLETVGSLRGGAVVFGLARLKDSEFLGEVHRRYLLCQTRHDGSGACLWFPTSVRVVCMNTNMAALSRRADRKMGAWVSHNGDTKAKIEAATAELEAAFAQFSQFEATCKVLADTRVTSDIAQGVVVKLFPGDDEHAVKRQDDVLTLATYGRANARFAGTAYALFNGITEYVDHHTRAGRSRSAARRFEYATLGTGAQLKQRALDECLRLAA